MLTLKEINEVSFGKAGFSGYKPEDVDNFIDVVSESFKQLLAEREAASKKIAELTARNSDMQDKLAILAEKIENYRKDEEGIKDAIITAQRMARISLDEANQKARLIVSNAEESATELLNNAKTESAQAAKDYMQLADEKRKELEAVKKQVTAFRASLLEMYKKHLECIDHIPSFKHKQEDKAPAREEKPAPAMTVEPVQERPVYEPEPQPAPASRPVRTEMEVGPLAQESPERAPAPKPMPVTRPAPAVEPLPPVTAPPAVEPVAKPVNEPVMDQQVIPPAQPVQASRKKEPPLSRKLDYTQEQQDYIETSYMDDNDLSEIGINTKAFSDIPESLRKEKRAFYSNLEFGEGIDVTNH